jgi:hypothetical protein
MRTAGEGISKDPNVPKTDSNISPLYAWFLSDIF